MEWRWEEKKHTVNKNKLIETGKRTYTTQNTHPINNSSNPPTHKPSDCDTTDIKDMMGSNFPQIGHKQLGMTYLNRLFACSNSSKC